MGLIKKIFGGSGGGGETKPGGSSQFAESTGHSASDKSRSRNSTRRDLVRLVLRETMRKHGIPSDWLDVRALSVVSSRQTSGMHVQFLVRKADQQLLPYVHAFQESFMEKVQKLDPTAGDWLLSVGWEFYGKAEHGFSPTFDPAAWSQGGDTQALEGDTLPPEEADEDLQTDLQALQAAMSQPANLSDLPQAAPRPHKQIT